MAEPNPQQEMVKNFTFSAEELRTLRECDSEAFFQRSLPISAALGTCLYLGVQNGYFNPHVKYGAVPKVVGGVILGYFLGKFSYRSVCEEKLMRLPNSRLADILRQRYKRDGKMGFTDSYNDEFQRESEFDSNSNFDMEMFGDHNNTTSALELDTSYNSLLDYPADSQDSLPKAPKTNFDEIRKRNREEYEKRQRDMLKNV